MKTRLYAAFVEELRDVFDAEHQIAEALPKMIKAAEHADLQIALDAHLEETQNHITRLERAFQLVGEDTKRKKCKATHGILLEAEDMVKHKIGDAGIIASAQKVEHYEIATYGTLVAWANMLGHESVAALLQENLDEEKNADVKLTMIAELSVNADEEARAAG